MDLNSSSLVVEPAQRRESVLQAVMPPSVSRAAHSSLAVVSQRRAASLVVMMLLREMTHSSALDSALNWSVLGARRAASRSLDVPRLISPLMTRASALHMRPARSLMARQVFLVRCSSMSLAAVSVRSVVVGCSSRESAQRATLNFSPAGLGAERWSSHRAVNASVMVRRSVSSLPPEIRTQASAVETGALGVGSDPSPRAG